WNCVVYIIPARLIFSMDNSGPRQDDSEYAQRRYTAKSDGLKRIFGLKGNIMKGMQGDNTLRGIGMLLKGTKPNTPPGLGNYDNSCYQNSVIQGLAALPSMKAFLSAITIQFPNLLADSTNGALYDTINKLNDPTNHGQRLWTPSKLKSMSSWMQQDAQEYFSKLLDDVDKEIIRSASSINRRSGIEAVSKERGLAPNDEKISAKGMDRDLLQNPLDGLLAQRVGCTRCGYSEGLSMIPFNCLTVPLGRDYLYDIRDCLVEYTDLELIEGVECVKCTLLKTEESLDRLLSNATSENLRNSVQNRLKTVREALDEEDFADNTLVKNCQIPKKNWISSQKSRQAVVARPPKSLVIHVNRSVFDEYTGAQMKNNAQVQFPKTLDMRPWCLGKDLQSTEKKNVEGWSMDPTESMLPSDESLDGLSKVPYELRAVVTHFGRHENGHYVCYRKHPLTTIELKESDLGDEGLEKKSKEPYQTERWWRLSDDDVSPVTEQDVLARGNVFMLFYEQIPLLTKPTEAETETAQLPNDDLVSSS
ncbi:cysteine proteinase, partial [Patellaria atrata CBS 101060]